MSDADVLVRLWYFSITTLTTVGYGDYHPRSDIERLAATGILLVGVALFSLITSDFLEILQNYRIKMGKKDLVPALTSW